MKKWIILIALLASCKSAPQTNSSTTEKHPEPPPPVVGQAKKPEPPAPIRSLVQSAPHPVERNRELLEIEAACARINEAVAFGMTRRRALIEAHLIPNDKATEAAYYLVLDLQAATNALARKARSLTYFDRNKAKLANLYRPVLNGQMNVMFALRDYDSETSERINIGIGPLRTLFPEVTL